jgi:predicted AlkP superfamily pyrophosphatase or phosphodiesterase
MYKLLLIFIFSSFVLIAQNKKPVTNTGKNTKPKLIVGIVVDQMRNDYISRYWNKFGNDGFKKLVLNGYYYKNAHYNYVPTYTGPGHASIYTGTTPANNGIIANEYFDRETNSETYCVSDPTKNSVGSQSAAGKMSPRKLLSTTLGDELKLHTVQKSKVIGIALKDRGAILPAGHSANAAYWFDGSNGCWISSDYYMKELPAWVKEFNSKSLPKTYLQKGWNTLLPIEQYTESIKDDNVFESVHNGKEKAVFPYDYSKQLQSGSVEIIKSTPYGNSLTKDFAIATLTSEELGKDEITDLLCISFSSTDYVGHACGPRAIETEDTYLRLDMDIAELLFALDTQVGNDNYILFLTADHGACDVPGHLKELNIPAGNFSPIPLKKSLQAELKSVFGDSLILDISNQQIFLNEKLIADKKINLNEVENYLAKAVLNFTGVKESYTEKNCRDKNYTSNAFGELVQNGFHAKKSGHVIYSLEPGWIEMGLKGTTHGACYTYDTHVPVIFYGKSIPKGNSLEKIKITDIAPTICAILEIPFPNACTGTVLEKITGR